MYKTGFVFAILAIIIKNVTHSDALTDDQKAQVQAKFLEHGAECIKDHPLSVEDITAFKEKKLPEDGSANCFVGCVFKNLGIMDESGNLSHADAVENAKKIFDDEEELKNIEEFLTTCSKVNDESVSDGEKGCDRAALAYTCLVENSEKFGFNIDF